MIGLRPKLALYSATNDSRTHWQQGLQKPVVVAVDVDGKHSKLWKMRGEVFDVVKIDEALAHFDPLWKQRAGQPHGRCVAVDEQTPEVAKPNAVVFRGMKTKLQECFRALTNDPRQDHALVGLWRPTKVSFCEVKTIAERGCAKKGMHARLDIHR
ncbi:hypothetical protein X759_35530 [Mesorhizobium sp. LSHC420B00]|nr:hypothetical protein X759_35530 [Mesorhizobium sp. LSHC420B00]